MTPDRRRAALAPFAAAACLALACPAPRPEDPEAVAVFEGGVVTARELDRVLAALPPGERPPASREAGGEAGAGEAARGLEELVRRMAARRLLAAQATATTTGPAAARAASWRHEIERQVTVELCLRELVGAAAAPAEEELRALFAARPEAAYQPERRRVLHLFRRAVADRPVGELEAELATLGRRVAAGENFSELARSTSDSESRHAGGQLGWLERGQLAPKLESAVFSLEPGVPSRPVTTPDGVHLFLVEEVLPARRFSFEEVRAELAQQVTAERRERAIAELLEQAPAGGVTLPEPGEVERLFAGGEAVESILEVGGQPLPVAELQRRLAEAGRPGDIVLAGALIEGVARAERLAAACRERGLVQSARLAARLDEVGEAALAERALQERLRARVAAEPERIAEHYRRHRQRYSAPLRLRLRRLRVPLGADANADMAAFERLRVELDAGVADLDARAAALRGEVDELGWLTLDELEACCGRAAFFAADLDAGAASPPWRGQNGLEMVVAMGRREPEPLPLDEVRDRVIADLIRLQADELIRELEGRLLEEAGFRLLRTPGETDLQPGSG